MTEQEKREKVIKGLEIAVEEFDGTIFSPMYDMWMDATKDALALLKAQEPRVMTLEEAKAVEGYAWLECCDRDVLSVSFFRGGFYIEPFERPLRADLMNWADYNKGWRYWTSCPTNEQREATPWE